jgi:hypothetical protein
MDSEDNIYIVFHHYHYYERHWRLILSKYIEGEGVFTEPVHVEFSSFDQFAAGDRIIAVDSQKNPYVVFMENSSGSYNIRIVRSMNGGLSFESGIVIDPSSSSQITPTIAISEDDTIYTAWTDNRSGVDNVFFAKSVDGGATFSTAIPVDPNQVYQNRPSLAVDSINGIIHITWTDYRRGICYVYYSNSIDDGISFSPGVPVFEFPQ